MNIKIDQNLTDKHPFVKLASLTAKVKFQNLNIDLKNELQLFATEFLSTHKIEDIAQSPAINDTRKAYRAFGKQPARYRVSSEALLRRIVQGKGLYFINNIVDVNNLVSVKSKHAVCCFDADKIQGEVSFKIAESGAVYQGIGKGVLNIENLPVFADDLGAFGSPTSDSQRTMVTDKTENILFVIVSFSETDNLEFELKEAQVLLERYCQAEII